jgi:hypothetical protein
VYGNPARIHGHVCRCGKTLRVDDAGAACECGLRYVRGPAGEIGEAA